MSAIADIAPAAPLTETQARKVFRIASRYGLSSFGPISVSGAHFVASLAYLHFLQRAEFGLFAFLFVIVPLCMSVSSSLLTASMTTAITNAHTLSEDDLGTHFKFNLVISSFSALVVFLLVLTSEAPLALAAVMAIYGGAMTMRWFGRSYAYLTNKPMRAVLSDLCYSILLLAGLGALIAIDRFTALHAAEILLAASSASFVTFGWNFLSRLFRPGPAGSLLAYAHIWRNITRWSLSGVLLTEVTGNAHAYLVTLVSGPASFAVLALGSLMMRPVSLVMAALPDLERPAMARAIAAGDVPRAFRSVKEFRTAAGAIWLATILLVAVLLIWFPHFVLKKGYDETQAIMAIAIWAAIQAVRTFRMPESVLMQAAREFRPLAGAGLWSSLVSFVATLILLLLVGPVASLCGVLLGDLLMTRGIFAISNAWRLRHA